MRLSLIVPVLNESAAIENTLQALQSLRALGHELIVVDGGSSDDTVLLAGPLADRVLSCSRGRAKQMHAGAEQAVGDVLWFIHGDTRVPESGGDAVLRAVAETDAGWGRFDVRLSGSHWKLRLIEWSINRRSRLSGIASGDQAMFITRNVYFEAGGWPDIPLMEDIALSKRLRSRAMPVCLREKVITSSRRWETHGVIATVLLMWWLRAAFFFGVSPERLARWYAVR